MIAAFNKTKDEEQKQNNSIADEIEFIRQFIEEGRKEDKFKETEEFA
mgnify:CR=1 FL=1